MENEQRKCDTTICKEFEAFEVDESSAFQQSVVNTSDPHGDLDLDTGWSWVVMFAAFGTVMSCGGIAYATGLINSLLLEEFKQEVAITAWVGALNGALTATVGPISSATIDRFSCRTAIIAAGVLQVVGYLGTAFAPSLEIAILTCGIIGGIGNGLGYTAGIVVIGFNFKRKRSLALGVASSGVGVGLFVIAPVMQFSREFYGYMGFFIILAAITINNITFGTLCFPSKLEKDAKRRRARDALLRCRDKTRNGTCSCLHGYTQVILNKGVLCLSVSMLVYLTGIFIVFVHLPMYIVLKGFSQVDGAMLVSLSGILSVVGRFTIGILSNLRRIPDIWLYSGSMFIVAIATASFPFYSNAFYGQIIYAVVLGTFQGTCYVLAPNINIKFVGLEYMSAAFGMELFFGGFGSVAGPIFAGFLVDSGGTYDQAFYVAGFCILLGGITSAASQCFSNQDPHHTSEVLQIDAIQDKHITG